MSLSNSNPVQKLVIGGEPLKKSVATEAQKVTTVINPAKVSDEQSTVGNDIIEPLTEPVSFEQDDTLDKNKLVQNINLEQESKTEKVVEVVEISKQNIPNNNLIKDEETIKMLKSLAFWSKFHIILGFISAGFLILAGVIYIFLIITIPITIIYWAIAGVSIWLLIKLYKGFGKFEQLAEVQTQDDFNTKTLQGLDYMKSYYKITGILQIASFVFLILMFVVGIVLLIAFGNNPAFQDALKNANSQSAISPKNTDFLGN